MLDLGNRQLAAGQWLTAEKTLLKARGAAKPPPCTTWRGARHSPHQRHQVAPRPAPWCWPEDAPDADKLTVQLTRAEFLLDDGDAEQARVILESLHNLNPRHPGILQWLAKAYQQLHAWEPLQNRRRRRRNKGIER
ncbi:MAG: hypothetical protein R3F40_15030 [Candidatus Competibacteraceae bacterium]